MSPHLRKLAGAGFGFPRVSGDEPATALSLSSISLFSPRERG